MNADIYRARMTKVSAELAERDTDAVVIGPSPDLTYLTGYDPMPLERATFLIVSADAAPVMIVPELERPLATAAPIGSEIEIVGWIDGVDPYAEARRTLGDASLVAVGDRLWASHLIGLQTAMGTATFSSASEVIGAVRAIKDDREVDALRRAGAGADAAFEAICTTSLAGRTEREVAADLARLLLEHGHDRVDFTIVASGPNGASPHHEPGARTIGTGDAVVMDFGGSLDGYCSDTTRTVVVGEAPGGFEAVYEVVRRAQTDAVDAVRPGVTAGAIDRVARGIITEGGYGDRFVHRTGHGIGLEVHEPPYIIEGNETVLQPGMAFSVEPGVYLPGVFGIRIEDIVVVTTDGVERLNRSDRTLRVVG